MKKYSIEFTYKAETVINDSEEEFIKLLFDSYIDHYKNSLKDEIDSLVNDDESTFIRSSFKDFKWDIEEIS